MVTELTRDSFARCLNDAFEVQRPGAGAVALELIEAGGPPASGGDETFSIVFRGPPDAFLPQATYRFGHDGLGAFDLFIVPVGPDQAGHRYEAVFNRPRRERDR